MQPKNPDKMNENREWATPEKKCIHKDTQLATTWIEEREKRAEHRKQWATHRL